MGKGAEPFIRGYKYYRGEHHVLCHGPVDELLEIKMGDRVLFSGSNAGGIISVNKPGLFGGTEREGGVKGKFHVLMGQAGQVAPVDLLALFPLVPGFRGLFSILFPSLYYGANNPYPKRIEYMARRRMVRSTGEPMWYDCKVQVGEDMNPAHIFYECLTDPSWGGRHPSTKIDEADFMRAADRLSDEGMGLSFRWSQPADFERFLTNVEGHAACKLRVDPETNKYQIKLIRGDYVIDDLPVFDESNIIKVTDYQGNTWDGTINEVILTYYDIVKDYKVPVVVQDIGNQQIQGRKVSKQIQMDGICDGELATRVALRELRAISTPLSSLQFNCNRTAWGLNIGDVFVFSHARYNVVSVVYRVQSVNWGTLEDGEITVNAIQDVFALPQSVYVVQPQSLWVAENSNPLAAVAQRVVEATYWDVVTNLKKADIAQLDPDYGFVAGLTVRPNGRQLSYQLWTRVGAADYVRTGSGPFCPSCLITPASLQEVVSTWPFAGEVDIDEVVPGRYAYIDNEIVQVVTINTETNVLTVNRGVLDTVPVAHSGGARLYFAEGFYAFDRTERIVGESVDGKVLSVAPQGMLDLGAAAELNVILDNRPQRPYPPGNVKLNALRYPAAVAGDVVITWAHRDRLLQTAYLVDQTAGNVGPEPGTTYTVRIYQVSTGLLKHTQSGIAGVTYNYTQAQRHIDMGAGTSAIRIEIESIVSGLISYQTHNIQTSVSDV